MSTHLPLVPPIVLAIAAHPDDIEFMAGGTLAHWSAGGSQIHYLIATDGASGSRDPGWTPEALAAHRREEQRRAAALLGVASVTFLGLPDAGVEVTPALRLAIARMIRQVRPTVVLTFDPHLHYRETTINHPDHIAIGASTLGAVMPLANTLLAAPTLNEEGLAPHDVEAIYLFEPANPTHWVPLTPQDIERKLTALRAHASQLTLWDGAACALERARRTAAVARAHGVDCIFAEDFSCIRLSGPQPQPAILPQATERSPLRGTISRQPIGVITADASR